jgi:hypothetical protein
MTFDFRIRWKALLKALLSQIPPLRQAYAESAGIGSNEAVTARA